MGSPFFLTPPQGVVVSNLTVGTPTATQKQPLSATLDITSFDYADVEVGLVGASGLVGSPTAVVDLLSSMQRDSDDGSWISLTGGVGLIVATTAILSGSLPSFAKQGFMSQNTPSGGSVFPGLLRYLRWSVTVTGTSASIAALTFWIAGIGRKTG